MEDPQLSFIGNLRLGSDISLAEVQRCFDVVVLAYGAGGDATLGLPGEDETDGVMSARAFVNW